MGCLDVDDFLLLGPDDPGAVQGGGVLLGEVLLLLRYVGCACTPVTTVIFLLLKAHGHEILFSFFI